MSAEAVARIRLALEGSPAVVQGLQQVEKQFDGVKSAMAGLVAGATVVGLMNLVKAGIDAADAMDELSERTGLAVKDIAGLKLAYSQAGLGSDALEKTMGRLSKAMADGNDAFDAMGVKVKNTDGTLRPMREVLGDVADKFATYEDGAAKAALAQELFGKSGTEMVSLLKGGSEGLAEMDDMARKLGLTMDAETAANAAKFNDTLELLGMGVQGVGSQIAAQLLPTLSTLTGELLSNATKSGVLQNASAVLGNTLKGLYTVAAGGVQIFSNLGRFAGAAAAAVSAAASGNFSGARDIMSQVQADNAAAMKATMDSIKRTWQDGGNAGVQAMATVAKAATVAAPIMAKPGKAAQKSMKEARDEAMELFKSLQAKNAGVDPSFQKNLKQLHGLYADGKITVDQYRDAVEQLIGQQKFAKDIVEANKKAYEALLETQEELAKAEVEASKAREAASRTVGDYVRGVHDSAEQLKFEATTIGMTNEARAIALAQYKVELDLRKKIADINAVDATPEWRDLEIQRLTAAANLDKLNVAQRAVFDEARKNSESITNTLTDALMRGFEGGKGFAKNFRDTLKSMFQTLVLRPIISFIVQPIGNAISGMISGVLGGGQGGGGILGNLFGGGNSNFLSGLSSLWDAYQGNGMSGVWGQLGSWMGVGSWGATSGAATAMAGANFSGAAASAAGLVPAAGGGAAGAGGSLAGIAGGVAAVAIPLIIGAIVENNSRDRSGGAAFATSDWRNDPTVQAGGVGFNTVTGQIPAYQDMVNRMVELGYDQNSPLFEQLRGNERAMYVMLQQMESRNRGEYGEHQALPNVQDLIEMYGSFYQGQGYADPQSMGWWNWKDVDYASVDPKVVAASRQLSLSIVDTLTHTAQALGQDADFRVTTGWANRGKGKLWGAAQIMRDGQEIAGFNRSDYKDTQHYMQAVFSSTMDAFKTFDLPGWATNMVDDAKKQIDALTGDKVGEEAAAIYQTASQNVVATLTAIKTLIDVFPDFSGATQDVVFAIAQEMGGLDKLQTAYAGYVQNFYTQAEQADLARKQVESQFAAVGQQMPASREAFRAMVESLDKTTEEGQRTFAALMGLSGAFAQITADGNNLAATAFEGADQLASVIREGLLGNLSSQQVGEQMADVVMGGIYNAIAGGFANQITQIMMDGVVTPMLQAAVAGTSVSEAVSQAAIDKMIADATAAAQALGQILNSEQFQSAMQGIQGAMLNLAPRITAPQSYYTPYATRRANEEQAAEQRRQAAENARRAAEQAAEEEARRLQAIAIERLGLLKQLLTLEGNQNALREIELQALDPSNRAMQQRIWALQDAAEAEAKHTAAMKEAETFLAGFTRSVDEFIFNTRMADRQTVGDSYQLAAAKFSAQMVVARAGDREALGSITSYAGQLIDSIRRESATSDEAQLKIGRVLGQLAELPTMLSAEELIVQAVEDMKNTLSGVLVSNFDMLDTTMDGALSFAELQASGLASDAQIRAMIARIDANGDGMISKTEAVRAQAALINTGVGTTNSAIGSNTVATNSWGASINTTTQQGLNNVYGRVGDVDGSTLSGNSLLTNSGYSVADRMVLMSMNTTTLNSMITNMQRNVTPMYVKVTSAAGDPTLTVRSENRNTGTAGYAVFAQGGVFSNGLVDRPTAFNMGLMGEAGPEAIMPLVRAKGGYLGVRALGGMGDEAMQELLGAILTEMRAQRLDARARHASVASPLMNIDRRLERFEVIGLPRERAEGELA